MFRRGQILAGQGGEGKRHKRIKDLGIHCDQITWERW